MYGLMKAHICSRHQEASQPYRLHYCGVCKTMGSLYGQKSRFLLNYDAVFLAEMLTALSPDAPTTSEWSAAYQSYNCFSLPGNAADMPLPLQVAAAATLLMTEFKVADQITDGGSVKWKFAHTLLASPFDTAAAQMEAWKFPLDDIRQWGAAQDARETAACQACATTPADPAAKISDAQKTVLAAVAEPTAAVTALVFRHSGAALECSLPIQERLYALGFAFGSLVYVLDALEDYAKDRRQGAFNALQAAFGLQESALPADCAAQAAAYLRELRQDIEQELWGLPLPPGQAHRFVARLRANLDARLDEAGGVENYDRAALAMKGGNAGGSAPLQQGTIQSERAASRMCANPVPRPSLRAQGREATIKAQTLTARYRQQRTASIMARFASPGVFGMAWTIAFCFPEPAKTADSYEECLDIPRNLMFVGAALRRWLEAVARLLPTRPPLAVAGGTGSGVLLSRKHKASGSGNLTHSSSGEPSVVTVKKSRRPSCCGDCCSGVDCDACCCACEGADCCCDCGACDCGSCCDCGDCCSSCS